MSLASAVRMVSPTPQPSRLRAPNSTHHAPGAVVYALPDKPQHSLGENKADVLLQPLTQSVAPVGITVGVARVRTDPHHVVPYLDRRRGNIVGPKVKGAATSEVKTRVMPMARQDAVFDRAWMSGNPRWGQRLSRANTFPSS